MPLFKKGVHSIFHHSKHGETDSQHPLQSEKPSNGSMGNEIPGTNMVELRLPLEGGGYETLIVPNDHHPRDTDCPDPEHWHFNLASRKASVAASDTGDTPKGASDVEKAEFTLLCKQTEGMTPEEVKAFLEKRGHVDGAKVMRRWESGRGQDNGYYQLVEADQGAF